MIDFSELIRESKDTKVSVERISTLYYWIHKYLRFIKTFNYNYLFSRRAVRWIL